MSTSAIIYAYRWGTAGFSLFTAPRTATCTHPHSLSCSSQCTKHNSKNTAILLLKLREVPYPCKDLPWEGTAAEGPHFSVQ